MTKVERTDGWKILIRRFFVYLEILAVLLLFLSSYYTTSIDQLYHCIAINNNYTL